jgi:hypothetical protein
VEPDQADRDKRKVATHRSRVMLAATMLVRGLACNVRIRNVSETGALIEGDVLPEVGASLLLQRGNHEVGAEVVWVRAGRCGVRFAGLIVVSEWAGVQATTRSDPDSSPLPSSLLPQPAPPAAGETLLPRRVAEEIAYVQRLIDSIGEELVANPVFVNRYQRSFQNFDLASQILGHLSRVLMAEDQVAAADQIGMQDLRKRLLRS